MVCMHSKQSVLYNRQQTKNEARGRIGLSRVHGTTMQPLVEQERKQKHQTISGNTTARFILAHEPRARDCVPCCTAGSTRLPPPAFQATRTTKATLRHASLSKATKKTGDAGAGPLIQRVLRVRCRL
jgi:hypothetical protein